MKGPPSLGQLIREPVRVEVPCHGLVRHQPVPPAAIAVAAIVPCCNRRADLANLLADLSGLQLRPPGDSAPSIHLSVLVVDNASTPPLSALAVPPVLEVEFLRLDTNTGGSGGFNAGLSRVIATCHGPCHRSPRRADFDATPPPLPPDERPRFLWLLDSDARVRPDTLGKLVDALETNPGLVAAGSAIADPGTGVVFEVGGRVNRRTGRFEPVHRGSAGVHGPVVCDYIAACSALVRREAVERAGLLPDVFLNGDDVEWCIRLARATGGAVAAIPDSIALHPTFDRFPTWARYYIARNGFGPIDALALGPAVRFRRALREVARAAGQSMMDRADLSRLHLRGLSDAVPRPCHRSPRGADFDATPTTGPASSPLEFEPFHPIGALAAHLIPRLPRRAGRLRVAVHDSLGISAADEGELARQLQTAAAPHAGFESAPPPSLLRRLVPARVPDIAVVPARGRPSAWLAGRIVVQVTPQGFVIREPRRLATLASVVACAARGLGLACRMAARRPRRIPGSLPPWDDAALRQTLAVVVLSYNRWDTLRATLAHLTGPLALDPGSILVVDNASTDGTPDRLSAEPPPVGGVGLRRSGENRGVDAFNRAVDHLLAGPEEPEVVLILDDDAHPEPGAIESALSLLARRPDIGAVTLHPRHPVTGRSEWPFGARADPVRGDDSWPVMGCANLVRSWAWRRIGGYEPAYFLYRNDTDLALKLLAAGIGVHFNPTWVVQHDSPGTERKSTGWHRLATRNWVWTARRHATGPTCWLAILLGWAWAHRLAGLGPRRHLATLRGLIDGLACAPPPLPRAVAAATEHLARLVRLQVRAVRVR